VTAADHPSPSLPLTGNPAQVWRLPFYRNAAISLFLSGMGISAAQPLLTLFFVNELGVSLSVASLYFLTAFASLPVSILLGRVSDRLPSRLPLIRIAGLWVPVGWVLMAVAQQMWMVFAIAIIWLSVSSTMNAQTFAAVRDDLINRGYANHGRLITNIRVAWALGWVLGPMLGTWFGMSVGMRPLFLLTAALFPISLLPTLRFRIPRASVTVTPASTVAGETPTRESAMPLYLFIGCCIIAMSGETLKWSFLPVYMEQSLDAPSWLRGAVISTHPFMEVSLIPLGGLLAERLGGYRVILVSVLFGAIGYLMFAIGGSIGILFLGQFFSAIMLATLLPLGMAVATEFYPSGPGYAASVFLSGLGLASSIGGLIGSTSVRWMGLPEVFLLPTFTCLIAALGLFALRARSATARS